MNNYILRMLRDLFSHRELIVSFAKRTLIGRYRGSFLGIFWSFINPLFLLLIYTIVFSFLFKIRPGVGDVPYSIFLFAGMIPWIAFSEALSHSTSIILENKNLVKKTVFPLEILPVTATLAGFIHSLFGLVILLSGILLVRHTLYPLLFLLPLVMVLQIILTIGLCWFLASLGVFIRDISHMVGLGLTALMYLTPILYPIEMIPTKFRWLWAINPMYGIVNGYRSLLLQGTFPDWKSLLWVFIAGLVLTILGYSWFMKTKKVFADVI